MSNHGCFIKLSDWLLTLGGHERPRAAWALLTLGGHERRRAAWALDCLMSLSHNYNFDEKLIKRLETYITNFEVSEPAKKQQLDEVTRL